MKKKSLLLTWTRWTAAGIANLTMAISPLAMGKAQEARASALADFQKAYKEVGLGSGATVGEVWEKMRGSVSGDVQAMMDPMFRGQKVKFPKVDVVPFKDKDGSEKLRILVQGFEPKQASMTITFWDKDDKYIQFNNRVAKRSDAESLSQLARALGVNIENASKEMMKLNKLAMESKSGTRRPSSVVPASDATAKVFKSAAELAKMDINKQLTYMVGMRRLYDAMEDVQRLAMKDPNYAKTKIIIPSAIPEEPQFTYIDWFLSVTRAEAKSGEPKVANKKDKPKSGGDGADKTCVNGGWIAELKDKKVCDISNVEKAGHYNELNSLCQAFTPNSRPCNPSFFGYTTNAQPICITKAEAEKGSGNEKFTNWANFSQACARVSNTDFSRCKFGERLKDLSGANPPQRRIVSNPSQCIDSAVKIVKSWMAKNDKCKDQVENARFAVDDSGVLKVSNVSNKCSLKDLPEYTDLVSPYSKLGTYCFNLNKKTEAEAKTSEKSAVAKKVEIKNKCQDPGNYAETLFETGGTNKCNQYLACDALTGRFLDIVQIPEAETKKCDKEGQVLVGNDCKCDAANGWIEQKTSGSTELVCVKKCDEPKCQPCPDGKICPGDLKQKSCKIKSSDGAWSLTKLFGFSATRDADPEATDGGGTCKEKPHDEYSCNWPMDYGNPFGRANYVNQVDGNDVGSPIAPTNTQYSPLQCAVGFGLIAMLFVCLRQRITTHKGFCGKAKPENNDIVTDTGVEGGTTTTNPILPAPAVVGGQQ